MTWSAMGAAALALAVILGAFGAHGLKDRLDAYSLSVYEKAVFYHFVHGLGILIVSLLPKAGYLSQPQSSWVCGLLTAGIILFSGSLYVLAITRIPMLGAVTPFGGLSFIAAWLMLAWILLRNQA
ncbi:MAG: DUF423 domain-containing protein [Terriglobia bacterium]|nr:MAG: DUF423 domain-containing protein [Terriglobia bacterium]